MSGDELANLITDRGGQGPAPAPRRRKSADSAESTAKRKKNIEAKDSFIFATLPTLQMKRLQGNGSISHFQLQRARSTNANVLHGVDG